MVCSAAGILTNRPRKLGHDEYDGLLCDGGLKSAKEGPDRTVELRDEAWETANLVFVGVPAGVVTEDKLCVGVGVEPVGCGVNRSHQVATRAEVANLSSAGLHRHVVFVDGGRQSPLEVGGTVDKLIEPNARPRRSGRSTCYRVKTRRQVGAVKHETLVPFVLCLKRLSVQNAETFYERNLSGVVHTLDVDETGVKTHRTVDVEHVFAVKTWPTSTKFGVVDWLEQAKWISTTVEKDHE